MNLTETSLVLVAIMPKARDMEIARVLGWYRIPLKSAPKILQADWIAFYQTTDFGPEHKSRIERYAEVRGVELTTRSELFKDEPTHPRAAEEYYKVQLGPLQTLRSPILAGSWKRFLFFYTTGERFFNAERIHDLAINGPEKETLWRTLQERMGSAAAFPAPQMAIPSDLLFLLGNLSVAGIDLTQQE